MFPCPRAYLRIWSRETGSGVPSRVSLFILQTQAESGAYLRDSSRVPRRRPFMKLPYAIGSAPTLLGHAIAYRWRSLPRVRRHRASKPQGSSERVLPWQVTVDQLICASLSQTPYWYEVVIASTLLVTVFSDIKYLIVYKAWSVNNSGELEVQTDVSRVVFTCCRRRLLIFPSTVVLSFFVRYACFFGGSTASSFDSFSRTKFTPSFESE